MTFFPAQIYKGPQNNVFLGGRGSYSGIFVIVIVYLFPFDLLYSPSIPYLLFLSSLVLKLSKSFQKSVRTFFIKFLIYSNVLKKIIQAKGVVQQAAF